MLTDSEAQDETFAMLQAAWDAASPLTDDVPLLYENTNEERPDATGAVSPWAYAQWQRATSRESSLAGVDGQKRFTTTGLVSVQLFAPIGDGGALLRSLGRVFQTAFRGKRTEGGVVFSRVRVKDVGASGPWWYNLALAEFQFDEVM